jgi:colicin import membrane protein
MSTMNSAATERLEFAPPPDKGSLRALALALLVHLLLIAALTWGVHWKHSEEGASFEAELWSASAPQAAPESPPVPPQPPPEPTPPAPVTAPLPPPVKAPEVKAAPTRPDADIALEKENEKKRQQQKEAERQQAKRLQEKQQAELQAQQAEKAAEQKLQAKALAKEKLAAAEAAEKRHQEAVKRMIGMAGATAGSGAAASKGPSAGYSSKVIARILPNVVFTDDITGSPRAEVEVRSTADGTIMSQRLVKSSGNKAWDDAVLKAIVRTGSLPRDIDGSVPTPMIIGFQPGN